MMTQNFSAASSSALVQRTTFVLPAERFAPKRPTPSIMPSYSLPEGEVAQERTERIASSLSGGEVAQERTERFASDQLLPTPGVRTCSAASKLETK